MQNPVWRPNDLVGCRYRVLQAARHPELPPTQLQLQRRTRAAEGKAIVQSLLPTQPQLGDKKHFQRIDLPDDPDPEVRFLHTLEALATGANIIWNAQLMTQELSVEVDILVRRKNGTYYPVVVSSHRIERPGKHTRIKVVATQRLGLGNSSWINCRVKHHSVDSFRLAAADRCLAVLGLSSRRGGLIGQDHQRVFLLDTDKLQSGLDHALATPVLMEARRTKECDSCRFWSLCEPELKARDDITLFLRGDQARPYREQGLHTVEQLIQAGIPELSARALAWRREIPVLARTNPAQMQRFDVEIDIDVEAYLDQGAYLWGTYDAKEYLPFVIWDGLGQEAEGNNFARFWQWLQQRQTKAEAAGQSFGVFCYSAHGENHWLLASAQRFAGVPGVPSVEEVREFIASKSWVDVFEAVRGSLIGTKGLGLKLVEHHAGFARDYDLGGEESMHLYRLAIGQEPGDAQLARETLLQYNGDDCRGARAVRTWLSQGTPGIPSISDLERELTPPRSCPEHPAQHQ